MNGVWLLAAALIDALLGDPPTWPHPVSALAKLAAALERRLPRTRLGGALMLLGVTAAAAAGAWLLTAVFGVAAQVLLVACALGGRSLRDHALAVLRPLAGGDLPAARRAVARIVGRDTDRLDASEVARAAVESVAENACDGYVAPLFWAVAAGAAGVWAFKAVSTMDSIYGHLDERNREFGWASARLDDLANWLPARLTALMIAAASGRPARALNAVRRGARLHPSPNAGFPESAMAGALGLRLGGANVYDGVADRRPVLAPWGRAPAAGDIARALRCFELAAALGLAAALAVRP